jgi:predicted AAA+ superfamily ATPase
MPVGRIEYLFLGPLNFEEFLSGLGQEKLVNYIKEYSPDKLVPEIIHEKLLKFVKKYFVIGGMPAVIRQFSDKEDYKGALREQKNLLQTYIDDFNKYKNRIDTIRLQKVFLNFPLQVGHKVKYVNIDRMDKAKDLAESINLLNLARVIYSVKHSNANGVPLGAEVNNSDFKALFIDIGLMQSLLNLRFSDVLNSENLIEINSGALAEQFVGQHLLYNLQFYEKPELFYWNREKKNSSAEIDYLQQIDGRIIPVEVKAGKTGSLKSLHLFVSEKKSKIALRIYCGVSERVSLATIMPGEEKQNFTLISIPFYLIGQINRFIKETND